MRTKADDELKAMTRIYTILAGLDPEARSRIFTYVWSRIEKLKDEKHSDGEDDKSTAANLFGRA